jgi:Rps23 Pro-64 3,4-dihydroxylase Tpa1-like proline 4-hydroxylase
MIVRKEEFLALKQGPLSVSEYRDKFLQLSRYAPEDVNTDAKWQYRFLRGLVDPLHYQLMNHTFPTFQHLIDRAIMTERKRQEMEDRKHKIGGPQAESSNRPHYSGNSPQQFKQGHQHQHQHQRQHQHQY